MVYDKLFRYKKDAIEFKFAISKIRLNDTVKCKYKKRNPFLGTGTVIEIMSKDEYMRKFKNGEVYYLDGGLCGISGNGGRIIKVKEQFTNTEEYYTEFDLYRIHNK